MTVQERNELFGTSSFTAGNHNPYYDPSKRVCPVCRAPCSVKRVIPIYVRTETTTATTSRDDDILNSVETVMDDEIDDEVDVADENHRTDGDMDMFGVSTEDSDTHQVSSLSASTLHTTGIRNRSRTRTSISEVSHSLTMLEDTHPAIPDENHSNNNSNNSNSHDDMSFTLSAPGSVPGPGASHSNSNNNITAVPRRPVARSSSNLRLAENADVAAAAAAAIQQHQPLPQSRTSPTTTNAATTTPTHHPASLAHGMLPLVQQAIRHAAIVAGTTNATMNHDMIPPIHRLEGMHQNMNNHNNGYNNSQSSNYGISMDYDSTSTDFLSWILLLLGIFVLACLILF